MGLNRRPRPRAIGSSVLFIMLLMLNQPIPAQTTRLTEDERNTVEIIRQASRGVVHINVRTTKRDPLSKVAAETGTGTGFVIDHEGRILTAYHVIENANEVQVMLPSGRGLLARLVGTAPMLDIALLQVDAPAEEILPLKLGKSESLEVGQKVIAIGNPLGLHNTVTVGIVSALERSVEGAPPELQEALIQTDAAINPGSSGGPLLDSTGEVIGISNARIGNTQGLGFAIPIDFACQIIPDLIKMGHPYIPELGFHGSDIKPDFAELFGLPLEAGVLIEEIEPHSPAAEAGLQAGDRIVPVGDRPVTVGGDIITAVNGQPVGSVAGIAHLLLRERPGATLRLTVSRNSQTREISIPLQEMRMSSSPRAQTEPPSTSPHPVISKKELKSLIQNARTPADHQKIAAYYRSEAERLMNESKEHQEWAEAYAKARHTERKNPVGLAAHCREFADYEAKAAKKAQDLAALHESLAAKAPKQSSSLSEQ